MPRKYIVKMACIYLYRGPPESRTSILHYCLVSTSRGSQFGIEKLRFPKARDIAGIEIIASRKNIPTTQTIGDTCANTLDEREI